MLRPPTFVLVSVLAVSVLALSGCNVPTFTNPIIDPNKAERFVELYGTYQSVHPDSGEIAWLHVGACDEKLPPGFHKFVSIVHRGSATELTADASIGFFVKVGDSYLCQIPIPEVLEGNQATAVTENWGESKNFTYFVCRFLKLEPGFRLDYLSTEKLEAVIEENKLAGRIEQKIDRSVEPPTVGSKTIVVTASTEELGQFFSTANLEDLFDISGPTFTKQSSLQRASSSDNP